MNTILYRIRVRHIYMSAKKPISFLKVPYKEQYESRDNENETQIINQNCKNKKEYINVSDNLENDLKHFYKYRYLHRDNLSDHLKVKSNQQISNESDNN